MAKLVEIKGNLFNAPGVEGLHVPNIPIVHCISADYKMGAGIAKEIKSRYNIKSTLKTLGSGKSPGCIVVKNIINAVTKEKYWHKPTYESFEIALRLVGEWCLNNNVKKVVMPRIGSGLDKLDWIDCREIIKRELVNTGIDVEVYYI